MAHDFDRGRRVGKYELLTRISVGGMAELYLAFLPGPAGFKKFFALKQILPDLRDDEHFVQMFLDEARISALLSHPNIGQVFDLGRDDASGELYLAMEFITGQNLSSLRKAAARVGVAVPVPVACRIARDMCLGLHAAHTFTEPSGRAHPIVHRDIAPKNVMVSYSGHVKVIDFGIAKARGRLVRTQAGQIRGTPSYMAPEQWREQPVDARTDLYAVGHVLNELLTGERRPPVATAEAALVLSREAPVDPSQKNKHVSALLGALVVRSIANRPEDRVQTGKEFALALEQACPDLADEWQVSTFISQLFEPQVASTRALFEAAQQDAAPERISGLVKKLSEEVPAPPQPKPPLEPKPEAERLTLTEASVVRPAPARGWLGVGVIALVIVAGAAIAVAIDQPGAEPPPEPKALETIPLRAPGVTAALQRAEAAMAARNFSEAEASWEEVLTAEPAHWPAVFGAGVAARRLGHRDLAEARLGSALERAGTPRQKAIARFELGCLAAQRGEPRAALEQLQQAVDLLGLEAFGEALGSEEDLTALREDPDFKRLRGLATPRPTPSPSPTPVAVAPTQTPRQLLDEGLAAVRTGNFALAVTRFERCVKVDPLSHACFLGLGNAHTRLGHRDEARVAYRRYLERAPVDDPFIPKVKELLGQ